MSFTKKILPAGALTLLFTPGGALAQATRQPMPDKAHDLENLKASVANLPLCAMAQDPGRFIITCGTPVVPIESLIGVMKQRIDLKLPMQDATVLMPDSKAWIGDIGKLKEIQDAFSKDENHKGIILNLYPEDKCVITGADQNNIMISGALVNTFPVEKILEHIEAMVKQLKNPPPLPDKSTRTI